MRRRGRHAGSEADVRYAQRATGAVSDQKIQQHVPRGIGADRPKYRLATTKHRIDPSSAPDRLDLQAAQVVRVEPESPHARTIKRHHRSFRLFADRLADAKRVQSQRKTSLSANTRRGERSLSRSLSVAKERSIDLSCMRSSLPGRMRSAGWGFAGRSGSKRSIVRSRRAMQEPARGRIRTVAAVGHSSVRLHPSRGDIGCSRAASRAIGSLPANSWR